MKTFLLLVLGFFAYPKTFHYSTEVGLEIWTQQDATELRINDVPPYLLKGCGTSITLYYFDGTSRDVRCPKMDRQVVIVPMDEFKHITTIEIAGKQFHN